MINLLKKLSACGGVSGCEQSVSVIIAQQLSHFADQVQTDTFGNVFGIKKSKISNAPTIMAEAHIDGIGLMVTGIHEKGFVTFLPIGGVDPRVLPGQEVEIFGKTSVYGVIGAKPPHLLSPDEAKKPTEIRNMAIDTGYDKEELCKFVSVGDVIAFRKDCVSLGCEGVLSGKYMDNRAGAVALLRCFEKLKDKELPFDLCFAFTVQEEVGFRGAIVGSASLKPAAAVVVDVSFANTPDSGEDSIFPLGSGTVISTGPNISPVLKQMAVICADEKQIPYHLDADGGSTGTNAWAIQVSGEGVATLLLSIPIRYMHTTVETVAVSDIMATADLLYEVLLEIDPEVFSLCILKN